MNGKVSGQAIDILNFPAADRTGRVRYLELFETSNSEAESGRIRQQLLSPLEPAAQRNISADASTNARNNRVGQIARPAPKLKEATNPVHHHDLRC
jgi:hypothetical protein